MVSVYALVLVGPEMDPNLGILRWLFAALVVVGPVSYTHLAANSRQVDAIIDEIEDKLREEASIKPTHREMSADGS